MNIAAPQNTLLKFKLRIRMGKKDGFSDFGMVAVGREGGLRISETADLPSLEFTEKIFSERLLCKQKHKLL